MGCVLVCGVLGFWVAAIGLLAGALGPLAALAVWAGSGPVGAALALLLAASRPPREPDAAIAGSLAA